MGRLLDLFPPPTGQGETTQSCVSSFPSLAPAERLSSRHERQGLYEENEGNEGSLPAVVIPQPQVGIYSFPSFPSLPPAQRHSARRERQGLYERNEETQPSVVVPLRPSAPGGGEGIRAADVLQRLGALGVRAEAVGGAVRLHGPVPLELRDQVTHLGAGLGSVLQARAAIAHAFGVLPEALPIRAAPPFPTAPERMNPAHQTAATYVRTPAPICTCCGGSSWRDATTDPDGPVRTWLCTRCRPGGCPGSHSKEVSR